jgi:hypothetical protein
MPRVRTQKKLKSEDILPTITPWTRRPSLASQQPFENSECATEMTPDAGVQGSIDADRSDFWDRRLHPLTFLQQGEGIF